jgi:hypothetical protein
MKYRIVGADGKQYGPIGIEQLRQWLAEGRVDSRTQVYVEGAPAWTQLGLLPEFAAGVPNPPTISAARPMMAGQGTNGFAVAGLVCALLAWLCCCCMPLNLLAIIFCVVALVQISSQAQPQEGKVLAIIGLVLAGLHLLVMMGAVILQLAFNPATVNWANQFQ